MSTIRTRVFPALMLLVIVLSACATPKATPAADTPDLPPPLPAGYTDLLDAKVASGEWTQGQGIVNLLKMFTGEVKPSSLGLGNGVKETEGTGILDLAGEYLQNGDDPAIKAEITRLVNKLVPDHATLDAYSVPAPSARADAHLAAPVRNTAQDTAQECAALWTEGFPDTRTPSFSCFQAGERIISGNFYRVYFPQAWLGDTSKQPYFDATLQAAVDTVPVFRTYGELKSIYFVFPILPDATRPLSNLMVTYWASFHPSEEACPVLILPISLDLSIPDFKQSVAHEIFHCFEVWNLNAQGLGAGYSSAKWWVESAAEYFSNLVYPTTDFEHRWDADFSLRSRVESVTAMSYENNFFMQFIANVTGGPAGVLGLLRSLPTHPGQDAQTAALSAYPHMSDLFEQFTRQVFDEQLMDTSGALINIPGSYTGIVDIPGAFSGSYVAEPFVMARYRLQFGRARKFATSFTISGADGGNSARRPGFPGTWADLPINIQSGCAYTPYILYVITTVPAGSRTYELSVVDAGEAPCDQCLVGTWQPIASSYMAYMESVMNQGGDVTVNSVTGVMTATFRADGRSSGDYNDFVVQYTVATTALGGAANPISFQMTFNGHGDGTYTADGANLVGSGTSNYTVNIQSIVNGSLMDMGTSPMNFPIDPTNSVAYTCSGDTLTYYPVIPGMTVSPLKFTRVSTP